MTPVGILITGRQNKTPIELKIPIGRMACENCVERIWGSKKPEFILVPKQLMSPEQIDILNQQLGFVPVKFVTKT